jgi:hypothetical protein
MTHCPVNHHVTCHLVFVLASTECVMLCPAFIILPVAKFALLTAFITPKTLMLPKSVVNIRGDIREKCNE